LALAALPGLALAGAPAASAAARPGTAALPRLPACNGKLVLRPKSFVLACADANAYLVSIRWSAWTASAATGTSTFVLNDCTPNCAAGKFHDYPATTRLSRPRPTKHGELFSLVKVTYRSGASTEHYDLDLSSIPVFRS